MEAIQFRSVTVLTDVRSTVENKQCVGPVNVAVNLEESIQTVLMRVTHAKRAIVVKILCAKEGNVPVEKEACGQTVL